MASAKRNSCSFRSARWLGEDVYELFSREAAATDPGSEGLLFLPYLIGERCRTVRQGDRRH